MILYSREPFHLPKLPPCPLSTDLLLSSSPVLQRGLAKRVVRTQNHPRYLCLVRELASSLGRLEVIRINAPCSRPLIRQSIIAQRGL